MAYLLGDWCEKEIIDAREGDSWMFHADVSRAIAFSADK